MNFYEKSQHMNHREKQQHKRHQHCNGKQGEPRVENPFV